MPAVAPVWLSGRSARRAPRCGSCSLVWSSSS